MSWVRAPSPALGSRRQDPPSPEKGVLTPFSVFLLDSLRAFNMTEATETPAIETPPEEKKKIHQTVDIKDVGPCKKHIKVTVHRTDIDASFEKKFKELVGDSWIPGFRPGKAPKPIVQRKFRKDVHDQVKGEILLSSLEQLADEFDVAPLSAPNLNTGALEIPEKEDFVYEFEVEVRPHFDLPEYKGLKLKKPVREFTDARSEEH